MQVGGVELAGVRVLVIGLARSGLSAIRLLREHGAQVTASDEKALEQMPEVARELEEAAVPFIRQSVEAVAGQQLVVISPGVPVDAPVLDAARAAGSLVIGELELASYFLKGRIIAITGSNGKTTTTALTGHVLERAGIASQVGGNIGTPPTAMIANSRPGQWNVLEVSSFQLETISHFRAHVAVCLNVTPDHLDRHHTMDTYAAAKGRLFETQAYEDFAVLNADDESCVRYGKLTPGRTLWFSLTRAVTPGLWLEDGKLFFDEARLMDASEIPLRGRHNIENVLAAAASARMAGATLEEIADGVRTFPGVEHRLEFVRSLDGVDYFNDSKATNVDAAMKAVDAFDRGLWIILGGKDKGGDFEPLCGPLAVKAKAALLIGAATERIAAQLGCGVPLVRCGTMEEAVRRARAEAVAGDTVLLAPACASFDQFANFEHRGRVFKELVGKL